MNRQKIVFAEGPDGVGKTQILTRLSRAYDVPYFRMGSQHDNWRGGRFKDALELDQTYLKEMLRQTKYNLFIDRGYPSERVYSSVFGRETNIPLIRELDIAYAEMGAIMLICLRRDYSKSREDEVIHSSHLPRLHDEYLKFADETECDVVKIYVDDFYNDIEKQMEVLVPEFEARFERIMK